MSHCNLCVGTETEKKVAGKEEREGEGKKKMERCRGGRLGEVQGKNGRWRENGEATFGS